MQVCSWFAPGLSWVCTFSAQLTFTGKDPMHCQWHGTAWKTQKAKNFRGVVQCFPGKSAKDPVTCKTLEPQGCDSLWQNYVK